MRTLILRVVTVALAAAAGAAVGCSSGGCGGTNINSNTGGSSQATSMQCGNGTYLNSSHQCVPLPSSNNTQAARTNYISN